MIKFLHLKIENFLSVSTAELPLDGQGLVLIEGVNEDDPSAKSNGAGKSSIVDAISWCLFGETARGVTGDSVVNIKAGKGTMVGLGLEIDGALYTINRHRKHKTEKNRVVLKMWDGLSMVDMTLGTDKLTQERINNLLGCTPDIFNASIYMGQEAMPDLPGMTDKQLKGILEAAMSLDKLDDALEVCKQRLQTVTHDATTATAQINRVEMLIDNLQSSVANLTKQAFTERVELSSLKAERDALQNAFAADQVDAAKDVDVAKDALDKFAFAPSLARINEEVDAAAEARTVAEAQPIKDKLNEVEKRLLDANGVASTLKRQIIAMRKDGVCVTCGRASDDAAHLAAEIARLEVELSDANDKANKLHQAWSKLEDQLRTKRAEIKSWRMDELNRLSTISNDKVAAALVLARAEQNLKELTYKFETKLDTLKRMIATKEDSINRKDVETNNLECEVQDAKDEHRRWSDKQRAANVLVDTLEKVRHILGRKGFRGEVLDQITPYLNARTHHYLSQLTDDNISATWNTVSENAAGDYVESFHIDVAHTSGVDKFQALSGGEKRKVRLACALALQDLVGTRAVKPIKLFVADEIDDAIDEAGLELLMGLLEQKAREVGTVFVISHNDIGDWVRNKITVVKSGGQSTFKTP